MWMAGGGVGGGQWMVATRRHRGRMPAPQGGACLPISSAIVEQQDDIDRRPIHGMLHGVLDAVFGRVWRVVVTFEYLNSNNPLFFGWIMCIF